MRKIDFVFFDAGGGHRSAATALKSVAGEQGRPWQVRLMNLQEVLDKLDIFRRITGVRLQDIYNRLLASGRTLGSGYLLSGMHLLIRIYHPAQVRMLAEYWRRDVPDMVVSLVPNFNRALLQGLRRVPSHAPFVTILTDFADYPPHFWIEKQEQYLICGTERAYAQAVEMGHSPERVFLVSGMILRPEFYREFPHDRSAELLTLDLEPGRPTGLVLFGGQGSPKMLQIARALQNVSRDLQLIFICGRNEALAGQLRAIKSRFPIHVVGFTSDVPYYMSLSDFLIGKPGPGSISEALAMRLPLIIERNIRTLPQERYNADWVSEKQVGVVLRSFDEIARGVEEILEPDVLERLRENVVKISNRAVYEILDLLEKILRRDGN